MACARPGASLSATTTTSGPTLATTQLTTPTGVSLTYGTVAGSIAVSYTGSSNAAAGQTYTVEACTNLGMTTGCVTNANLASGSNLTGLAFTQGSPGTSYYVTVTANASAGYIVSPATAAAGPQADTSSLAAPGTPVPSSSTILAGAITATFSASAGAAPSSYTVEACTNAGMTTGCLTQAFYASGAQIQPLTEGTSYYVQVTAVSASGAYTSTASAVSAPIPASKRSARWHRLTRRSAACEAEARFQWSVFRANTPATFPTTPCGKSRSLSAPVSATCANTCVRCWI